MNPTLRIDPRPAYEFLLSVITFATPQRVDSYDVGPEWYERTAARVAPEVLDAIARLTAGCEHLLCRLFATAHDLEPPATPDALVEGIEALDADTVRLTLLGYYARRVRRRCPPDVIMKAARGDASAQRRFISDVAEGPECERALSATLAATGESLKSSMLDVMRGWRASVWDAHEEEAWPVIEREAERLRARTREVSFEALIEEASGGASFWPMPGVETIEVFPTWVLRPWNISWEHGSTLLLGVPVPAERLSADPDEPPDRLVRLTRALGDERRLRILRRLTTGDYSLHELSEHFGIPKTTLLHHLVALRAAGIVRVTGGTSGKYTLRAGMPLELIRLLDAYLPAVRTDLRDEVRMLG